MNTRRRLPSFYRRQRARRIEALKLVSLFLAFLVIAPVMGGLAYGMGGTMQCELHSCVYGR